LLWVYDGVMRLIGALAALVLLASSPAAAETLLLDGHIHYSGPDWSVYTPDQIVAILDKAGIARALVSSTPDDGTLKLYERDPKRVIPILRPYRSRDDMSTWWRDPTIIPYLQQRLAKGVHKGIGEFHLHGKDIQTPVLKRIIEIAVQGNLYLHAHSDDAAVIELFAIEPRSKIIWGHAGMSSGPEAVGALMDKYPSLWADLSYRYGDVAPGGTLDPAWRALLIRHADRFILGSDTWTTSRWEQVVDMAAEARRFLEQLPPDVAAKIAHRNIEKLFP
jgi:amidohydrolase family protein